MARQAAKAWAVGSKHGRGENNRIAKTVRLKIMKSVVMPTLLSFNRSRAWTKGQFSGAQRVANYAVRRAMGMDIHNMQDHHVSDKMLYQASGWETVPELVQKASAF